jgi:hypothetical protein
VQVCTRFVPSSQLLNFATSKAQVPSSPGLPPHTSYTRSHASFAAGGCLQLGRTYLKKNVRASSRDRLPTTNEERNGRLTGPAHAS